MSSAFTALARIAKPGQFICFRETNDSPERCGTLSELHSDGLIINTDSGTEWIPAQDIHAWRIPTNREQSLTPTLITPPTITLTSKSSSAQDVSANNTQTAESPAEELAASFSKSVNQHLPTPADIKLLFGGDPILPLPEVSFNLPSFPKNIQQEIDRWKSRYDYARKIREPGRISQDVSRIAELAETLENSSLYLLAGLLADLSGLGTTRAKTYFQSALELDEEYLDATIAIASLAIRLENWVDAAKYLLWAIKLAENADRENLVRCLGQCVLRINNGEPLPLGSLLSLELPDTAQRLANNLIAFTLKEDEVAYKSAIVGQIDDLRRTTSGDKLFSLGETVNAPVQRRTVFPNSIIRNSEHRGHVSAYYPPRNFGFIVEDYTGQTWFFHKTEVISPSLLSSLVDGKVRQDVTFSGSVETQSGKYPLANDINFISEEAAIQVEETKRAPLKQRLQAIPKDGSSFAKAMEAEQLDQLDRAETLYREEIKRKGHHIKSAIKNLAALKNRKGKPESALQILDQYTGTFNKNELDSLDQMRIQFLVKCHKYAEAANLLSRLANKQPNTRKRNEFLRQAAYCSLATGEFDSSIHTLNLILRSNPSDNASILLLEKARDAKETGIIPVGGAACEDEDEYEELLSSSLGLSWIARRQLDNCPLRGIDARTKESGSFTSQDVKSVQGLLDRLRGRRPRERADYLLTLAWLCERASNVTENRSIHEYLRRYFLAVAEASMSDDSPRDVVRCYALESLMLCPMRLEPRGDARNSVEAAWVLLLGTYLTNAVEASTLLKPETGKRLPNVLKLLCERSSDWTSFLQDIAYYQYKAPYAYDQLNLFCDAYPDLKLAQSNQVQEKVQQKDIENAFKSISSDSLSADSLRRAKDILAQQMSVLRFGLDHNRILELIKILGDTSDYALERHFRERETRFLRLEVDISRHIEGIECHPTHFSIERLLPTLSMLRDLLKVDFARAEIAKPNLELRNVLDSDFYVLNGESIALRLLLSSKDESTPPIEAIGLFLEYGDGEPCHSPEPLHGGQTREIELVIKPSQKQISDGAFSVSVIVEYRNRQGEFERSQAFYLAVRLGEQSFEEIPNPYGRYSGGSPVEDDEMFFGRVALIDRVVKYLSTGAQGQCFVLYGQKRSGKSSVLKQVEKRLSSDTSLFVPMSAGTFSPGNLWGSFARLFRQELTFCLEDANLDVPGDWPSRSDVDNNSLETIRAMARILAKRKHQIVVAIDEFTYIFESAKEDAEAFMRGWKALLEAKTFNALLIGQDTMPRFKQAFPNEFGVTHDERITYLNESEASALASAPILLNGKSRYRGQAMHRLFDLTAGSPFFLQVVCDQLVQHMNARKAAFVTEADINQVARILTVGGNALPPERFDALVTAAGEKVASVPRHDLWTILSRIARESSHSNWCYRTAITELPKSAEALKDLTDRDILAVEGDRVSIRVGLFSAWLRANRANQ